MSRRCLTKFKFLIILFLIFTGFVPTSPSFAKEKFVAVVITGDLPRYKEAHESFVKILRAGGLTEEKVRIYVQTPNPDPMSWANSIRKAVGVGADLIVTYGAPATLAAKRNARGVPVLFADVYDPVALGIVKTLAVPGGDITGVSGKTPLATLIKTFSEVRPIKSMGVLFSSDDPSSVHQVNDLATLAGQGGFVLIKKDVNRIKDIHDALSTLPSQADCLFVSESAVLSLGLQEILDFSVQNALPVISQIPGLSDMGALMTLEADPVEQGQLAGVHALQILTGQKAHTLPIRTPKKVSLIINLQVAKKLGLTVPFQALSMATRVIK
jgi:putative ABC transport system substrate-binding protein